MTAKQAFSYIKRMDRGLLGFTISESVNKMDNSYKDIRSYLVYVIENHPDQINLIEEVVIALIGYSFETLKEKMKENRDYYNAL